MSKSSAGWRAKMPFLEGSRPIKHEVQGTPMNFFPASIGCVFRLKGLIKPIIEAVAVLLEGTSHDQSITQREFTPDTPVFIKDSKTGQDIPLMDSETIRGAVTEGLAAFRIKTKKDAISQIMDSIDQSNLGAVGDLIMDSLKEVFPRYDSDNPPGLDFAETLEAPAMVDMLIGVFKANKGVFGPLGGRISAAIDQVSKAVETKARDLNKAPEGSIPGPNFKINSAGSAENKDANLTG